MNTLVWIGFSLGLFTSILMFTKKNQTVSDKILSAWLMLLAIEFMTCGIDYEIFRKPLLSSSFLLFNPSLFLYVKSLTTSKFKLKYRQLLHLIPFLFFEIFAYILREPLSLNLIFETDKTLYFRILFIIANLLSWSIYNPMSLITVHKYRLNLKNERAIIKKNENLNWILTVAILYVAYCIVAFLLAFFVLFGNLSPITPHVYNYIALVILVVMLGFYGLYQQNIPAELQIEETIPYQNSLLSEAEKKSISESIIDVFEHQKIFLNPELNMDMLAEKLKTPKHQLTEVLTTTIQKNFFQLVNSYRVEAVKKMLLDSKNNYSIEAIGYECGFSSKSTFYSVFKNMTNETPIQFKNRHFST